MKQCRRKEFVEQYEMQDACNNNKKEIIFEESEEKNVSIEKTLFGSRKKKNHLLDQMLSHKWSYFQMYFNKLWT